MHYSVVRQSAVRQSAMQPIAAAALVPIDDETMELRGLVVANSHRGQGLAKLLVSYMLDRAQQDGRRLVCITRHPVFFRRFGFRNASLSWLEHQPQRRLGLGAPKHAARVAMALEHTALN